MFLNKHIHVRDLQIRAINQFFWLTARVRVECLIINVNYFIFQRNSDTYTRTILGFVQPRFPDVDDCSSISAGANLVEAPGAEKKLRPP